MAQGHPESERLGGGGWSARLLTTVLLAAPALLPFPPCSAIPSCPGSPVPLTLRICSDHVLSPHFQSQSLIQACGWVTATSAPPSSTPASSHLQLPSATSFSRLSTIKISPCWLQVSTPFELKIITKRLHATLFFFSVPFRK